WRRGARGAKSRPVAHVVIAGAGPAGASLAYLLARRGLGVTLLERQTDFAREFRGEGLMPSGAEALGAMGLGPALDALPQTQIEALDVFRRARRLLRVRPEDLGAPGPRLGPARARRSSRPARRAGVRRRLVQGPSTRVPRPPHRARLPGPPPLRFLLPLLRRPSPDRLDHRQGFVRRSPPPRHRGVDRGD